MDTTDTSDTSDTNDTNDTNVASVASATSATNLMGNALVGQRICETMPLSRFSSKNATGGQDRHKSCSVRLLAGSCFHEQGIRENSQALPEGTCPSLHNNIVILAPDSLHRTKTCEENSLCARRP